MTKASATAKTKVPATVAKFRAAARKANKEHYELCLYVAGTTPNSTAAVAMVTAICNQRLNGRYDLIVVDVYQEPARARKDQIIAVPTLLKKRPRPLRRLVGDLSNRAIVLQGLNLPPDPAHRHEEEEP